jgi:prepilin-type N-terminal cleavage/methylation domain-containing protein
MTPKEFDNQGESTDMPRWLQHEQGFTLVEVLVVSALFMMLMAGGFGGLYIASKAARRQAEDTTGLELVQSKIEQIRGLGYDYPSLVFSNVSYSTTTNVTVVLDSSGKTNRVTAPLVTTIAPFKSGTNVVGHTVTAALTLQTSRNPRTIQLQALINGFTSTQ